MVEARVVGRNVRLVNGWIVRLVDGRVICWSRILSFESDAGSSGPSMRASVSASMHSCTHLCVRPSAYPEDHISFCYKVYVDKATNLECFRSLMVIGPEIVSEDPSSRFHIFSGFPKLYERASAKLAEARSELQNEPLIIRPSAQWYICDDEDYSESVSQMQRQRKVGSNEAVKDEFSLWHVCYSMHSSREELESAMQLLSPKWVVSTFPSCRAMELDYVQRNCFISRFSSDDLFWKLLDIDMEVSSTDTHTLNLSCCLMRDGLALDFANSKMEPVIESSTIKKQLLSLSPENL